MIRISFLFLPILIPHLQFLNKIIAGFNIFMLQGSDGCKNWLVLFPLQGKAPKKIHAILTETLGEHAPSYATVKNCVALFKRGYFSTCDAPLPGWTDNILNFF
jgi:hypothetical protein